MIIGSFHIQIIFRFLNHLFFSDCTTPFQVSVVTDATADAIAATIASSNKGKIVP